MYSIKSNYLKIAQLIVLFSLLSFIRSSSPTSKINLKWSTPLKEPKHQSSGSYLLDDGTYIKYWHDNEKFIFKQFDEDLIIKHESEFIYTHNLAEGELMKPTLLRIGNILLIFTEIKDSTQQVYHHFYTKISLSLLTSLTPHIHFKDIPFMGKHDREHLQWNVSPDRQRLLVTYNNPKPNINPEEGLDNYIELLDNNLKTIAKQKNLVANNDTICFYNFKSEERDLEKSLFNSPVSLIDEIQWTSENLCILAYREHDPIRRNTAAITVLKFDLSKEILRKHTHQLGDFYIGPTKFCLDENNSITLSSYYWSQHGDTTGVLCIKENLQKDGFLTPQLSPVSDKHNINSTERGLGMNKSVYLWQYFPISMIESNGSTYMIGEQRETSTLITVDNNRRKKNTDTLNNFTYKTIAVTKLSKSGQVEWFTHIHKHQTTDNNNIDRISFRYSFDSHSLRFIYLDNKNMSNVDDIKVAYLNEKSALMIATIELNGDLKKEALYKESQDNISFFSFSKKNSFLTDHFVIEHTIKKDWGFGKIVFTSN